MAPFQIVRVSAGISFRIEQRQAKLMQRILYSRKRPRSCAGRNLKTSRRTRASSRFLPLRVKRDSLIWRSEPPTDTSAIRIRSPRQRRSGKLRDSESGCHRFHQDVRSNETHCLSRHFSFALTSVFVSRDFRRIAKEWGAFGVRANTVAFGHVLTRLTQAKELGEAIEVNGKSQSCPTLRSNLVPSRKSWVY